MITQTDRRFKNYELAKGVTVEDFGCLLTSIYNAHEEHTRLTGKRKVSFPEMLNNLKKMNAFDDQGILSWLPVQLLLNLGYFKFTLSTFDKIDFSDNPNIFWIAEIPHYNNPTLSHFVNITAAHQGIITYFDVYDARKKQIALKDCRSVRELVFQ